MEGIALGRWDWFSFLPGCHRRVNRKRKGSNQTKIGRNLRGERKKEERREGEKKGGGSGGGQQVAE